MPCEPWRRHLCEIGRIELRISNQIYRGTLKNDRVRIYTSFFCSSIFMADGEHRSGCFAALFARRTPQPRHTTVSAQTQVKEKGPPSEVRPSSLPTTLGTPPLTMPRTCRVSLHAVTFRSAMQTHGGEGSHCHCTAQRPPKNQQIAILHCGLTPQYRA